MSTKSKKSKQMKEEHMSKKIHQDLGASLPKYEMVNLGGMCGSCSITIARGRVRSKELEAASSGSLLLTLPLAMMMASFWRSTGSTAELQEA
jgi:hypothetical protein